MSNSLLIENLSKSLGNAKGRGNELAGHLMDLLNNKTKFALPTMADMVPLMFQYNGKPLSLDGHFPMEPLYHLDLPRETTLMCSRQVGKTMNVSARAILSAAWTPHWHILFVAPFFETIRRVSTDYFSSLIDGSPAKKVLTGRGCVRQVLERSLPNGSRLRFTYAHRSADRARGIATRENIYDEYQMMLPDVVPVLAATMNASQYGNIITRAGTPLTNSNHLSVEFKTNSSRSHWAIKCSCGYHNVASIEQDLLKMIGPMRDDISLSRPGLVCAKCRNPVHPWTGQYIHYNPDKRRDHLGLHVPCVVLPMHCCNAEKWKDIWSTLSNQNIPQYTKFNELLGVPFDEGVLLLTEAHLMEVAVLGPNVLDSVLDKLHLYQGRLAIGVDWGGRGLSGESLTKIALCGLAPDGKIHVLFGLSMSQTASSQDEAAVINHLFQVTKPRFIAHDNLGIGARAEEMLVEKGIPRSIMVPMEYVGETQGAILKHRKRTPDRPRAVISVDKTRGLLHLIEAIKSRQVLTFQMTDRWHAKDLLMDLTHLRAEERVYVHSVKSETVLIQKEPGRSDDFVHAVHHAANILWSTFDRWPQLSTRTIIKTPQDLATYVVELAKVLDPETLDALMAKADSLQQAT